MDKMLLAIVDKGDASKVMASARDAGATGGTIVNARGTASSSILAALGLGDSKKELLYSFVDSENSDKIKEKILTDGCAKGVLAFVPQCRRVLIWILIGF